MTNTGEKPLVSIICPAYNAETTINETIKTILNQTYSNIEIIIVDDGSSDNTEQICKVLAKKDHRIKFYHIDNHGVAYARNYALKRAEGKYISFVDADDYIKPITIENMVEAAESNNKMLITCKYWHGSKHTVAEFHDYKSNDNPFTEIVPLTKYRFTNKYTHSVVWGALYHRDLLKNLEFRSDLYIGEDTFFFSEALHRAREIVFIDDVYYYYTILETSLAHKKFSKKNLTEITAWEDVCALFSREESDFYNECEAQLCWTCIKIYERAIESHYDIEEDLDIVYTKVKRHSSSLMRSPEIHKSKKAYAFLFLFFPKMMSHLNLRKILKLKV